MSSPKKINIACICGGTGGHTLLSGLVQFDHIRPTAIANVTDSGGSSGRIRVVSRGSLPPGDVRQCLHALLDKSNPDAEKLHHILTFRFPDNVGDGHSSGNLFITGLEQMLGGFDKALKVFEPYLKGQVIPVTLDDVHLIAVFEDDTIVVGEHHIDVPAPEHDPLKRIKKLHLAPKPGKLNPEARQALLAADLIVIGPGDLYTSILPNLLMDGMREVLRAASAPKIYVVNVMTKRGETLGFAAQDFVDIIESYIGKGVLTHVLGNAKGPAKEHMAYYYKKEETTPVLVENATASKNGIAFHGADMLGVEYRSDGSPLIRHDPQKLAQALLDLIK
ncbi:MAG: YvcK family protein [bacterium]|nr:YvcK family protein [bacterium]